MKIIKEYDDNHNCEVHVVADTAELKLNFSGNGDLYLSMFNHEKLSRDYTCYRTIYIKEQDGEIYNIFDKFYNDIILKKDDKFKDLVDNDWNIKFVSDDGIKELEDYVIITKFPDLIMVSFVRNNDYEKRYESKRKSSRNIVIRVCTSGSRNHEFVTEVLNLYNNLKNYEQQNIRKLK